MHKIDNTSGDDVLNEELEVKVTIEAKQNQIVSSPTHFLTGGGGGVMQPSRNQWH